MTETVIISLDNADGQPAYIRLRGHESLEDRQRVAAFMESQVSRQCDEILLKAHDEYTRRAREVNRMTDDGRILPDEPGIYDELHYEPSGMPAEFWHAILFAAGAVSVFWVLVFFAIRAAIAS